MVLPGGQDERVLIAARRLQEQGLARPIVLGEPAALAAAAAKAGLQLDDLEIHDPATSYRVEDMPPRTWLTAAWRTTSRGGWFTNRWSSPA